MPTWHTIGERGPPPPSCSTTEQEEQDNLSPSIDLVEPSTELTCLTIPFLRTGTGAAVGAGAALILAKKKSGFRWRVVDSCFFCSFFFLTLHTINTVATIPARRRSRSHTRTHTKISALDAAQVPERETTEHVFTFAGSETRHETHSRRRIVAHLHGTKSLAQVEKLRRGTTG